MLGHNLEKNLRKVELLRERGELDRALKQLQEWARRYPESPHYLYEVAIVAFDLKDYGTGITSLKHLLRAMPDSRDKILRACEERYDDEAALPLCEFLVDHYASANRPEAAFKAVERLEAGHLELYQKKMITRLRSLDGTVGQAPESYEVCLITLIAIAHALSDGEHFGERCELMLEKLADRAKRVAELCELELKAHPEFAPVRFALGRALCSLKKIGPAAAQLAQAIDRQPQRAADALALLEPLSPDPDAQAAYHRAIGQLALWTGDGARAARHLLMAADLDPSIRAGLIERLARAQDPSDREGLAAVLKLRLRLLIVENRYGDAQPLLARMRDESLCDPAELKSLLAGRGSGDERPSELVRMLAENAIAAGDLRGLATQVNSLADHESAALRSILKSLQAAVGRQPADQQLEWRALEAVLLSRLHDEIAANETLQNLWQDDRFDPSQVYALTLNCLERMVPQPALLMAMLPWALSNDEIESCRTQFERLLNDLEYDSSELLQALLAFIKTKPEHAAGLLQVIDGLDRDLGVAQKLRYAIALAALYGGQYQRAVPEFSVLLLSEPMLHDEVLECIQDAVRERSNDAGLQLAAFQILRAEREEEQAAQCLARGLELEPARVGELAPELNRMLAQKPNDAALWRSYCNALFKARRFPILDEMCRRATEALPPQESSYYRLLQAHMLVEEGRLSEGLTILAAQTQSTNFEPKKAEEILRAIIRAHPSHVDAHLILGDILSSLQRVDEAIESYEVAGRGDRATLRNVLVRLRDLSMSPNATGPQLLAIAGFLRRANQPQLAADIYERAMQLDGKLADQIVGELGPELRRESPELAMMLLGARAARRAGQLERACQLLVAIHGRDATRFESILNEFRKLQDEFPSELLPIRDAARVLLDHDAQLAAAQILADTARSERYPLADRIAMLEEFHRHVPEDRKLVILLIDLNVRASRVDAAEKLLRECLSIADFDAAPTADIAERLRQMHPERADVGILAHDLLNRAGRVMDALRALPDPGLLADGEQAELSDRFAPQARRVLEDAELAMRYAESLWRQSRTDEALNALRTAAERVTGEAGEKLWTEYARRLHELGNVLESRRVLERLSKSVGNRRRFYRLFEEWNVQRLTEAGETLRLRHRREGSAQIALDLAENLLARGRYDEISALLSQDPGSPTLRARRAAVLARAHLESGKADLAEALLLPVNDRELDVVLRDEIRFLRAEAADQLGRFGDSHVRYLELVDSPQLGARARARATRAYQNYLDDASGQYRAAISKMTDLDSERDHIQEMP
jgi:predicted Zn-dependent protease